MKLGKDLQIMPIAEREGQEGDKSPARKMMYLAGNDTHICGDELSPDRNETQSIRG